MIGNSKQLGRRRRERSKKNPSLSRDAISFTMAHHERLGIEAVRRLIDRVCFVALSLGLTDCGGPISSALGHG